MIAAAATGFATGFSLILAIGAQNAFVLRQGLVGAHVFALCLFCAASDAVLIFAGVAGFGAATAALPWLPMAMTLAGAAFLAVYGALRLRGAWTGGHAMPMAAARPGRAAILATAALFTWANPHVWLDTLALNGAVSTRFPGPERWGYATGAAAASFVFFFGLGYGARLLAPHLSSPRAWQALDAIIGLTMWAIAAGLVLSL